MTSRRAAGVGNKGAGRAAAEINNENVKYVFVRFGISFTIIVIH